MDKSIFTEKAKVPTDDDLIERIGVNYHLWQLIKDYVHMRYPKAIDEWNFSGEKYGWSFRIKDKKRAILYFLPRANYFKVAFVFGQKATDMVMKSKISNAIKTELDAARVYAEGRGIRIDVNSLEITDDIKELINIKLAN
jgi:hypothetical protein